MNAFLGMGLLGSNFVRAMRRRNEPVQVWNRTAEKAKALEDSGAKAMDNPAEAVQGAERIHLTLKDDQSVNEVLAAAEEGLIPGAVIIDHTTTSAKGAIERTASWKAKGFTYLHAPVFMGPKNALESTGVILVSGDQQVITQEQANLQRMTGQVLNFGDQEGKAAGMKLIGNLFLQALTLGLSDALALAKALKIDTDDLFTLFESWNPGSVVPARITRMTSGNYSQPSWELNMARKDARLMMEGAKEGGTNLAVIPAIATEMDRWIEKGYGREDWTVVAKDSIP
jgi:3-hydroxyisobutyrate dehydrogenase